ncbi:MAG: putative selenium-dependent hydroxylase accessory protein YqeC, partial [Chloroflexi bacterium]|nr:putative selenium-dependent hydroxylase accessory protein YqeC [Chloroflexota bacterium]
LVTTTTKIYPPLPDQVDWAIADEDDDLRLTHVSGMLRRHAVVAALSGPGPEGKMNGVSPAWVERAATEAGADCVLVEADGAARRPIKAPARHEPVIPICATVVVAVIGLDALGAPLDAEHAHRPDRIAALTGLVPGEPLTAEAIALLATHPEGLAKGAPSGARLEYVLNKVDGPQEVSRARVLALALCRAGAPRVVLARAEHADPVQEVFGAEQAQVAV